MSRPIRVLDGDVADKIAAGEVIERPASVVKELVENAIDAGARSIRIDVREAGKESIRVTDDGIGIDAEQAPLAFLRHATSKIKSATDLTTIRTLGFRGEALPSIASVARVTMITRAQGSEEAVKVTAISGEIHSEAWHAPQGTQIEVNDLFYNTPARYKFLKSDTAERRAIAEYVTSIALAHPEIAFRLVVEGKELIATSGTGHLKDTIGAVLGRQIVNQLVSVEARSPWGDVSGYVGKPEIAKGNRNAMFIFINGRWIQNRMLYSAVEKGFESLLAFRRYPVSVLHVHMDPTLVDVNVHPAKTEVRFKDDREVFRLLMHAVRAGLTRSDLTVDLSSSEVAVTREVATTLPHAFAPDDRGEVISAAQPTGSTPDAPPSRAASSRVPNSNADLVPPRYQSRLKWGRHTDSFVPPRASSVSEAPTPQVTWNTASAEDPREILRHCHIMGQLANTYLVVATEAGLWLIDQHIAHERILYEQFLGKLGREQVVTQELLTPIQVTLSPTQTATYMEGKEHLEAAGFYMEPFGGNDFLLRSVPATLRHDPAEVIIEILEESSASTDAATTLHERMAASFACRAAVKAGDPLRPEESKRLLGALADTENPFACPHGRPIIVQVKLEEIARRFGRT